MSLFAVLAAFAGCLALFANPASAAGLRLTFRDALRIAENIKIPQEWDGVWVSEDSLFDCSGNFRKVEAGSDTLCGGVYYASLEEGLPVALECTGTADATTADVICTGILPLVEDCDLQFTLKIKATRDGENAVAYIENSRIPIGAGLGCEFYPSVCSRTKSTAMRTGAAPTDYCATPALPSTLGRIKAIYR